MPSLSRPGFSGHRAFGAEFAAACGGLWRLSAAVAALPAAGLAAKDLAVMCSL